MCAAFKHCALLCFYCNGSPAGLSKVPQSWESRAHNSNLEALSRALRSSVDRTDTIKTGSVGKVNSNWKTKRYISHFLTWWLRFSRRAQNVLSGILYAVLLYSWSGPFGFGATVDDIVLYISLLTAVPYKKFETNENAECFLVSQ